VSLGIQFLSPTMSRFLLHLFAAFAEMEPDYHPGLRAGGVTRGKGQRDPPWGVRRASGATNRYGCGRNRQADAKSRNPKLLSETCATACSKGSRSGVFFAF
jgi:hypothetical protein